MNFEEDEEPKLGKSPSLLELYNSRKEEIKKEEKKKNEKSKAEEEFDKLCSICMFNRNEIVLPKCYHPFCRACIGEWREKAKKLGRE